jgi:hypothetical protein
MGEKMQNNKPSSLTKEIFEFLNLTSSACIEPLLNGLAANQEIDSLITAASCEKLFLTKETLDFGPSFFMHNRARNLIRTSFISGSRTYPFIERMVDLSLRGETQEEKIDSCAKFIACFIGDVDKSFFQVMLNRVEKSFPDFLFEITKSQSHDGPGCLAATMIRNGSGLSDFLPNDMTVLPLVSGDMNLLEYTAIHNSSEMVDNILAKSKNPEDALKKMGECALRLLSRTPELNLEEKTKSGQNLTLSAMKMIAAGATLTEDQWKAISEVTIRPEPKRAPFRLPYIVARYVTPSIAEAVLTRMIKEGGISPDWKLHNNTTLLHAAVKSENLEVVTAVLNAGADPSLVDRKKRTPADVAREQSNPEMIRLLDAASAKFAMMKIINSANPANATNATNAAKKASAQ